MCSAARSKRSSFLLLAAVVVAAVPVLASADRLPQSPDRTPQGLNAVLRWNTIAIDASGLDHTPVAPGEPRTFGHQLGPGRASRAMAIVHIAVFEVVNAISGGYESYTHLRRAVPGTSLDAAVAQAAHDTLSELYPSHAPGFDRSLANELARVPNRHARALGIELGRRSAASVLAMRARDGSEVAEPKMGTGFLPSDDPGWWRQDPISQAPIALGAHWGDVEPFVLRSAAAFRAPPPPPLTSARYAAAFEEVKAYGGDGTTTVTVRTPDQTQIGIYWAYDGTPSLCAPPRLYNQITVGIARQRGSDLVETARLLALVNVAMADAGVAIWESKFHYQV